MRISPLVALLIVVVGVQAFVIARQHYAPLQQRSAAQKAVAQKPAKIEPIPGSKVKRVTLTAKAAERLGIQTAAVTEQEVVRKRTFPGEVASVLTTSSVVRIGGGEAAATPVVVRVPRASDLKNVSLDRPAAVMPLGANGKRSPIAAKSVAAPAGADAEKAVYLSLEGTQHGLSAGQRVTVELALDGSGAKRTVIPYSAVLYDEQGGAWTYTNPSPLVFVREPIVVDYIDGDTAVLSKGPVPGTQVVTVGGMLVWGTEIYGK